jgi:hypothetical protein
MSADRVRAALQAKIAKHGHNRWCEANKVSSSHASEFLTGRRLPTTDILDALGFEWRIVRKRTPTAKAREAAR